MGLPKDKRTIRCLDDRGNVRVLGRAVGGIPRSGPYWGLSVPGRLLTSARLPVRCHRSGYRAHLTLLVILRRHRRAELVRSAIIAEASRLPVWLFGIAQAVQR
jgi:hypothetical protein